MQSKIPAFLGTEKGAGLFKILHNKKGGILKSLAPFLKRNRYVCYLFRENSYLGFVTFEVVISVNNYLELKLYLKTLIYNLHPLLESVF